MPSAFFYYFIYLCLDKTATPATDITAIATAAPTKSLAPVDGFALSSFGFTTVSVVVLVVVLVLSSVGLLSLLLGLILMVKCLLKMRKLILY